MKHLRRLGSWALGQLPNRYVGNVLSWLGLLYVPLEQDLPLREAVFRAWRRPLSGRVGWLNVFGAVSIVLVIILVLSGILLSFHYEPSQETARESVLYLMTDVTCGWLVRYFAIHTIILPWVLFFLLAFHLRLVRRHGLAPPTRNPARRQAANRDVLVVLRNDATSDRVAGLQEMLAAQGVDARLHRGSEKILLRCEACSRSVVEKLALDTTIEEIVPLDASARGAAFFPRQFIRVISALLLLVGVLLLLSAWVTPIVGAMPDPFLRPAAVHVKWYFLWFDQLLNVLPSGLGFLPPLLFGIVPLLGLFWPLIDRHDGDVPRRPWLTPTVGLGLLVFFAGLTIWGDGATGIGGAHLLNAARRNIGISVLVFNNFNFGMTGGQHSTTTPVGAITSTTPAGNLERPLDVCATVAVNGASFVWRGTSFDEDLPERMSEAMSSEGFGLLDIWELCTAYFVPRNRMSRKSLAQTMDQLGLETGVLARRELPESSRALRGAGAGLLGQQVLPARVLQARHQSSLQQRLRIVLAGSAGGRVGSAGRLVARAALLSGLQAAQRNDYPITVKTGHSLAEIILDRASIEYTGIPRTDVLLLLSKEGRAKARHHLDAMDARGQVFALPEFAEVETRASVQVLDPGRATTRIPPAALALACTAALVERLGILSRAALEEAARQAPQPIAEENLRIIEAGLEI